MTLEFIETNIDSQFLSPLDESYLRPKFKKVEIIGLKYRIGWNIQLAKKGTSKTIHSWNRIVPKNHFIWAVKNVFSGLSRTFHSLSQRITNIRKCSRTFIENFLKKMTIWLRRKIRKFLFNDASKKYSH